MQILVLVKPVPDPEKHNEIEAPLVINPADRSALETARQLRQDGDYITVLSMAPESAKARLTECLALGADEGILISDKAFAGADTYATSYVLEQAIRYISKSSADGNRAEPDGIHYDLIMAGNESTDGGTSNIPAQIAQRLQWPCLTSALSVARKEEGAASTDEEHDESAPVQLAVKVKEDGGDLFYEGSTPAVIAVCREAAACKPATAIAIVKARKKPSHVMTNEELNLPADRIGLAGSKTQMGDARKLGMGRSAESLGETPAEAAQRIADIIRKAGA